MKRQQKKLTKKSQTLTPTSVRSAKGSFAVTTSSSLLSENAQVVPTKNVKRKSKGTKKKTSDEDILRYWLKQKLRRISYQYPPRKEAIRKARISRGLYKCAKCEGSFRNGQFQLDHIEEVDNPHTGFIGWDDYITRLFVEVNGWQILCLECHKIKTFMAQEIRKQVRSEKKDKEEDDI